MQQLICPRCKFRLTSAKAICNTCGYALQSARRPAEPTPVKTASIQKKAPAPAVQAPVHHTPQAQPSTGSFWRTFFGLDPLPSDKADREEALGET